MFRISSKIKGYYKLIDELVPILINETNSNSLHNKYLSKNYKNKSEYTFDGKLACGATTYVLNHLLKIDGISTKMMYKSTFIEEYKEDHCFLKIDNIIIDPTYRQFYTQNVKSNNDFSKFIFEELPFIFVGGIEDYKKIHSKLDLLHQKIYNKSININVSDFWDNAIDITDKIENKNLLKNDIYKKVLDILNI